MILYKQKIKYKNKNCAGQIFCPAQFSLMSNYITAEFSASLILITNKTVDKKSSHNPYMQDYARFFVQFLIGS